MSGLTRSRPAQGQVAVSVAGQEAAVEPAYYKPVSASPISSHMGIPVERTTQSAPVVHRAQRRVGMRYLWAHGAVRMPISPLGTGPDIGIATWSSAFQPDYNGFIHDAGFNDALFQAGYPGYNMGLSFKVQQLPENVTGPGANMYMRSPNVTVTISPLRRNNMRASNNG